MTPPPHAARDAGTPPAGADQPTVDGVLTALRRYAAAWSSRSLQDVADLWDQESSYVSYIAEEIGEVLVDRARISDHLLRSEQRLYDPRVLLGEVTVGELAPGLALATFLCRWDFEWTSYSRVSAVLRQRGDRWYFVHYMEAPFHLEDWGRVDQL